MSDNKHVGRGFSGKGYYIALILCAAAIGITSYVYYANTKEDTQVLTEEAEYIPVGTMALEAEDIPVLAPENAAEQTLPSGTAPSETKPAVIRPEEKKVLKTQSPVAGEELFGYSMEALSYNDTTRDWRVHNGVDLAAEEGTAVSAAAEGIVYTVYEDDTLGNTVVIRHEGGYTTRYSSLSDAIPVSAGDQVSLGQTIGYAGSTAMVETAMGSHVHFSVSCKDVPMDPAEFLSLGQ
ncbi:MAG: M23 family metallopeptidase [Oscillospiraceae bacterium]|nr:M23 family metallopeptidase [Oscillospiraceae bacterium]